MRVHHLNCGTMCPPAARLLGGAGGLLAAGRMVCHSLLLEAPNELVLIDTGLGTGDAANPRRLGQPFRALVRPRCDLEETALRQIEALALDPADVRHIVLTHLDLDHAGGLSDFPDAEVHVFGAERAASQAPPLLERGRYVAAQWAHGPRWVDHDADGDSWRGFDSVRLLSGLDAEIAMVPLTGHSAGHTGIAVGADGGWLLHCGDAYFHHREMSSPPSCPVGLRAFQNLVQHERKARRQNQERLRELLREHPGDLRTICSHDAKELERERSYSG